MRSDFSCPNFESHVAACVQDLLLVAPHALVF